MKGLALLLVVCIFTVTLAVAFALSAPFFVGPQTDSSNKTKVLVTFYPLAYLAEEIGGERVSIRTLIPYNVEVHSWQPSISDIIAVSDADIIILNGAGLDWWMEEEIFPSVNMSGKVVVKTTEGLPLIEFQGHEEEHEEEHGKYDPHTWLSPYMAEKQAEKIFSTIAEKDPSGKSYYQARFEVLKRKLEELDVKYQTELANKTNDVIIVAHEAYGYLAIRYGFRQKGIVGISADQQPSIQVIKTLANQMTMYDIKVIYLDPTYSDSYVMTLKREVEARTGLAVQVVRLYLALGPVDGKDYLGQIEANLEALKLGLVGP
ncbi:MAG: metal ABC transporter substrate-binding protein [Candidatus Methanomethylicaceae archaeon]